MKNSKSLIAGIKNILLLAPAIGLLSPAILLSYRVEDQSIFENFYWFYLLVALTLFSSFITYLIFRKPIQFSFTDIFIFLFCLLTVCETYLLHGVLNHRVEILILLTMLYIGFKCFVSQIDDSISYFSIAILITFLCQSVIGLMQLYGLTNSYNYLFKVTGTFRNPGPYACYLAILIPFSCYNVFNYTKLQRKPGFTLTYLEYVLSIASLVFAILIIPATGSRTAWIAVAFAVSLIFCVDFWRSSKVTGLRNYVAKRALQIVAFTGVGLLVVIGAAWRLYHMKQASADGRVLLWKVSLMAGNENYQTGVGLGYFPGAFGSSQAKYFQTDHYSLKESQLADSPESAFNEYLQIYVETGIVGVLIFILMISLAFFDGLRYNNLSGLGALTSFIFVSFTSYPFSQIGFLVLFVLVLIFTTDQRSKALASVDKKILSSGGVISILIIALSVSILICIRGFVTYGALQKWDNAKLLFYNKKYDEAIDLYNGILPVLNDQPRLLFEYGVCLSRTERFAESNRVLGLGTQISADPMFYNIIGRNLQAIKQYGAAEICFRKAMYRVPNRLYPRYLLAKLYIEIGDVDKAKKMAKWVLSNDAKTSSSAADDIKKEMADLLSMYYL